MASVTLGTNLGAQAMARGLGRARDRIDASLLRVATGMRLLRAADDGAGLVASEKLRAQVEGLSTAARNAKDASSLAQTADGVLGEAGNALLRLRDLAVRATNDALAPDDRAALQAAFVAQQLQLSRLAAATTFGGQALLDGSFAGRRFQVGARSGDELALSLRDVAADALTSRLAVASGSIAAARPLAAGVTDGANGVVAQSLSLQGPDGSADVFVLDNEDAGTVAARVDVVAGDTGITAVAATQLLLTAAAPAAGGVATGSFALSTRTAGVQGAVAVVAATIGTGGDLKAMASRVNAWIDTTGVSARLGDATNELVLRAAGGADIVVGDVITTDASGSATLLSATGLRDDGRGGLVATGAAVALPANAGVAVGGAVLLSAAGPLSVRTTAPGSLFAAATTDGEATSVASLALSTTGAAAAAVAVVDDALDAVAAERALLGGFQNRLDATIASLESTLDNVGAARARITDVDVAAELASVARSRVLSEAGVSLLAQANQSPRLALRLLTAPSAA